MKTVTVTLLAVLLGLPAGWARADDTGTAEDSEQVQLSADELQAKVRQGALAGKLTDELVGLFGRYADARAREKLVPDTASEDFWAWVSSIKPLHEALLVELDPEYDPDVVKNLATLHAKHGGKLDTRWPLAMAFACVYARAGDKPMSAGWTRRKDRSATPSMEESFDYYMKYEKRMHGSYTDIPWQLLVHVADNEIPIVERKWALTQYAKLHPTKYPRLYYYVPYSMSSVRRNGKLTEREYTLANILECGGVYSDRAFYASRVLKSLGVPSARDRGLGASQLSHSWSMWLEPKAKGRRKPRMAFSGRFDSYDYYTGMVYCPLAQGRILDRKIELKTAGLFQSYRGYTDAMIACRIFAMVKEADRPKAVGLLEEATGRSPYCAEPWRVMAKGVVEEVLTQDQGEQLVESMTKALKKYPDLTFEVLATIFESRIAEAAEAKRNEAKRNLNILERAFKFYEKAFRPDLAAQLRFLQGRYVEGLGRDNDALAIYVTSSQHYVKLHYGLMPLFERAMKLMADSKYDKARLKYLEYMAKNVPRYATGFNEQYEIPSRSFKAILQAYIDELRRRGMNQKADFWQERLEGSTAAIRD